MTRRRPAKASRAAAKPDPRLLHELESHKVELKLQNEELLESRAATEAALARYREIFDFAPIGYVTLEISDTIKEINLAGAALLESVPEVLLGKRFGAFVAPHSMAAFRSILARAEAEDAPARGELDLVRASTLLPVRIHATALPQRRPVILIAFDDISDRKQKEIELARSEHALREEGRRKDEFLGMLSHELRNPLAPIRTSVSVLQMHGLPSQDAREALEIISRCSAHLARLVDDLLDITRITNGKVVLRREPVDLDELVRRVVDEHRAGISAHGLTVEARVAGEPLRVDGDPVRLVQIVANLLANAEKFTPAGGTITVTTEARHSTAHVHVRDTGIGIAPGVLGSLGQPFVQAPQAIDRSRGGLGLGLAMVRSLVELHGGTVAIRSEGIGRGTEVIVSIPLCESLATDATPSTPVLVPARRVLLIEDNVDAARSLMRVLALRGHTVDVVHDGYTGIARAAATRPELVLCDLGLPDLDGYEVARRLRLDRSLDRTSLVALTGYALPDDIARAVSAGFDAHLAKPASFAALEQILLKPPRG